MIRLRPSLATLALAVVAGACTFFPGTTPDPRTQLQREVALHAAQWQQADIHSYTFTITRACFCPPEASGPFLVTVTSDVVMAVTLDGEEVRPANLAGVPLTVDAVFAALLALGPEATLTGIWDDELGFPTDVAVDPIPNAVDDEFSIRIEDFTPAG